MRIRIIALLLVALGAPAPNRLGAEDSITESELIRRSQEMFDAVAPGNPKPWREYIADDCRYVDERGRQMTKAALIDSLKPLPAGYAGTIKLVNPWSHIAGDVAILGYDLDETETVHGQLMTARYHATDTWRRRNGTWQIVAGQVLRYYEDPPAGRADAARYTDYFGTYELAPGITLKVTAEGGRLLSQRGQRAPVELVIESGDIFFCRGIEGRIVFRRDARGQVDAYVSRRNNEDLVWRKID